MNDLMTDQPAPDASPPPPPPPAGPQPNPFAGIRRSSDNRWIAGVAGGVARQFGLDVRLVRLIAVGLGIFGVGVPAYLLAWLLLPSDEGVSVVEDKGWNHATVIVVSALVVIAGLALAGDVGNHPGQMVTLVLLGVGVWLIVRPQGSIGAILPPPLDVEGPASGAAVSSTPRAPATPIIAGPTRPLRPRPFLTPLALALSALVVGLALLLGPARWTDPSILGSIVLGLMALALLVSAFIGRARGLIAIGVLVAVPLMIGTAVDGRWGDWRPSWSLTPTSVSAFDRTITRGFGQSRLDLSRVPFPPRGSSEVRFEQIAGDVTIVLPTDATVDLTATVDAGDLRVERSGRSISLDGTDNRVHRTIVTGDGSARVVLDAHLWAGQLQIVNRTVAPVPGPSRSIPEPNLPGAPR